VAVKPGVPPASAGRRWERRLRGRRGTPPRVGKAGGRPRRLFWLAAGPPLLLVAVVVALLAARNSSPAVPPPATDISAADRQASPVLVKDADAVGFRPTTEPGVGTIETQPASAAQPPSSSSLLPVGSTAAAFALKTPTGQTVRLADYRGKAVLLEFFATWCPHCAAEAPHLAELGRTLTPSRDAFVSVNADGENAPSVFAYHRYFGLPFPALLDPSAQAGSFRRPGGPGAVTKRYGVQSYPTFYVIGPGGRITWRSDGEQPDALLRPELLRATGG
jgi:cytochrome c biogenesis protein CcmG/thiol:disulfide interchange protein DsbE